jgi:membrane protein implicated in regulation of membrane protease activity
MSAFHPNIKLPIWLAVLLVLGAYVLRSALRGFDFSPDLPVDALVFGMFAVLLVVVLLGRRARASYEREEQNAGEDQDEGDETG